MCNVGETKSKTHFVYANNIPVSIVKLLTENIWTEKKRQIL